jgi:tetratricopeptide (TPR) repeat protein
MRYSRYALAAVLCLSLLGCVRLPVTDNPNVLSYEEHYKLATIYESKGENEPAVREYENAIRVYDKNPGAYFGAGNVYLRMKKYQEAEKYYLKAIELDPHNGGYYNNLGWLYMESGDLKKAESRAREAAEKDPSKAYIYLDTLGVIQTKENNLPEAEKALNEAARLAPSTEKEGLREIYNHLLEVYRKTNDSEKATLVEKRLKDL